MQTAVRTKKATVKKKAGTRKKTGTVSAFKEAIKIMETKKLDFSYLK